MSSGSTTCIGSPRSVRLFRREPSLKTIPEEGCYMDDEDSYMGFDNTSHRVHSDPAALIALERKQRHLPPYQRSMELDILARIHAYQMALHTTVVHSVPSIEDLQRRLQAKVVGENIIRGDSVYRMHQETMSTNPPGGSASCSSVNRSNILSKQFNEFGSAIATGRDGRVYCCQYFRRRTTPTTATAGSRS